MQEKLYDFSADYRPSSVVGDYSPVVVAAAVNTLCRNTASPRNCSNSSSTHLMPYEYNKYMPLYFHSSKIFQEYSQLLAKPLVSSSSTAAAVPTTASVATLLGSSPTLSVPYLTMQLPIRTSSLLRSTSIATLDSVSVPSPESAATATSTAVAAVAAANITSATGTAFTALPVKRAIDGSVKSNDATSTPCENHRTQSVIMKIEDQRIVEVPTNELVNNSRSNSNDSDEEVICKWINCYWWV